MLKTLTFNYVNNIQKSSETPIKSKLQIIRILAGLMLLDRDKKLLLSCRKNSCSFCNLVQNIAESPK